MRSLLFDETSFTSLPLRCVNCHMDGRIAPQGSKCNFRGCPPLPIGMFKVVPRPKYWSQRNKRRVQFLVNVSSKTMCFHPLFPAIVYETVVAWKLSPGFVLNENLKSPVRIELHIFAVFGRKDLGLVPNETTWFPLHVGGRPFSIAQGVSPQHDQKVKNSCMSQDST